MSETSQLSVRWSDKRCPRCGSQLLTDGRFLWCSFVGSQTQGIKPCNYGLTGPAVAARKQRAEEQTDD